MATEEQTRTKTTYTVFKATSVEEITGSDLTAGAPGALWETVDDAEALTSKEAIRLVLAKLADAEPEADHAGEYVAVSQRYWQPEKVAIRTERVIAFA